MPTGTISSVVTDTVTLGGGTYASHLTVTGAGGVEPAMAGMTGITTAAKLSNAKVTNAGTIQGGSAVVSGDADGNGIELSTANGAVVNSGLIAGGSSSYAAYATGGLGVLLDANGMVSNTGSILGGHSYGLQSQTGAAGLGVGVEIAGKGHVTNSGLIQGGSGGLVGYHLPKYFYGTTSTGGAGIRVGQASLVSNTGTILAGNGGPPGRPATDREQVGIRPNYNYLPIYGAGGVGVVFSGSGTLVNHGLVEGGLSYGGEENAGLGGDGVQFSGDGRITNTGTILAGGSRLTGGVGVSIGGAGTLTNSGTIGGGVVGGGGIYIGAGGSVANSGVIYGGDTKSGFSPNGGAGIVLHGTGTITNHGTIMGGNASPAGTGGVGVYLGGGMLVNDGTIDGGKVRPQAEGNATAGNAVQFGSLAATLVINPDAVFVGNVAANSSVVDTLELTGKGGTLSGLGTTVTGFTNIVEDAGARWTLAGSITGSGSAQVGSGGTLTLDGAVSIARIAFVGSGTAGIADPAALTSTFAGFGSGADVIDLNGVAATSLTYGSDKLRLYDASHTLVDTLSFIGKHAQSDFSLKNDGHGGTDVVYAGIGTDRVVDALPVTWHGVAR